MIAKPGYRIAMVLALLSAPAGAARAPTAPTTRAAHEDKRLLELADGESANLYGANYAAHGDVLAIVVLSSELVSVAILEGRLSGGGQSADPGSVLVTPIENGRTRRFLQHNRSTSDVNGYTVHSGVLSVEAGVRF
jgi:hypothetical protein